MAGRRNVDYQREDGVLWDGCCGFGEDGTLLMARKVQLVAAVTERHRIRPIVFPMARYYMASTVMSG
jgi:hypothetical protein